MRFLFFSDIHIHAFKQYASNEADIINSRAQDAFSILKEIEHQIEAYQVDCVFFLGDLFFVRNPINMNILSYTYRAINSIASKCKKLFLLVGNHDQTDKHGNVYSLEIFKHPRIENIRVIDKPGYVVTLSDKDNNEEKINVCAIPYTSSKEDIRLAIENYTHKYINTFTTNYQNILIGHFGVSGAEVGANYVLKSKDLPNATDLQFQKFAQIFLGHYHKPQMGLLMNTHYIGATHHHNWGDANQERGFVVWDSGKPREDQAGMFLDPTLIPLESAFRFYTLSLDELDPEKEILSEISKTLHSVGGKIPNNIIKIFYSTPQEPDFLENLSNALENMKVRAVEFEYKPKEEKSEEIIALDTHLDYEEMISQYTSLKAEFDPTMPIDQRHAVIKELQNLGIEILQLAQGQ